MVNLPEFVHKFADYPSPQKDTTGLNQCLQCLSNDEIKSNSNPKVCNGYFKGVSTLKEVRY